MKRISVIVPVYNSESYLPKCIDSIIGQTYENLEIILVNDGSTDQSVSICEDYVQKDSRIKVLHKSNGGQASARNQGLAVATGDYISFIDSDDWIDNRMYAHAMGVFFENPQIALVRYGVRRYWPDGRESIDDSNTEEIIKLRGDEIITSYGRGGCDGIMCSSVYRADIFKESGLSYPEGIVHEDEALSLAFSCFLSQKEMYEVCIHKEVMYNYQMVIGSTISKFENRHVDGICDGLQFVRSYINQYSDDTHRLVHQQIARMLRYYIPHWVVAGIDKTYVEMRTKKLRQLVLQSVDGLNVSERLFYSYPYLYIQGGILLQRLRSQKNKF